MVFFCCNGCGETLKKQKVDQHPCRSSYSCIDCNVNFMGNEYRKHTKCVSEAQRYQGNLYQGKEDKGALKQNTWMVSVREAAESCKNNSQLKGLLVRIADNDNVPRKKAKFLNFIKNSMRVGNKDLVEKAWDAIEKAGKPPAPVAPTVIKEVESVVPPEPIVKEKKKKFKKNSETSSTHTENTNGSSNSNGNITTQENGSNGDVTKPSKKRKRGECEPNNANGSENSTIKKKKKSKNKENEAAVLNESLYQPNLNQVNGIAPETPNKAKKYKLSNHIQELVFAKGEISLKKLKRKVTAAYLEYHPHKSPEEASRLFDKKVTKVAGVCVEHGTASKEVLDLVEA